MSKKQTRRIKFLITFGMVLVLGFFVFKSVEPAIQFFAGFLFGSGVLIGRGFVIENPLDK